MPGSTDFFKDVAFVVILGTAIITTVGVSVISRMEMRKINTFETSTPNPNITESTIDQEK